jgi:hypothetical protein
MKLIRTLVSTSLVFMRRETRVAFWLATALCLFSGSASSQMTEALTATTQKWTAGWDNFSEPLDFTHSNVTRSVNSTTRKLTVTFKLVKATPSKLYQVGVHIFCSTFPATFGQFPTEVGGGACRAITRQGVTETVVAVEFGVVTTDIHGNGSFTVVVGPIASGSYDLEFDARNGAGCNLTGGAGNGSDCNVDFQSPGPTFGMATTITIP